MYGENGPAAVTVKIPAYISAAVDYKAESGAARGQPEMLKAAGVLLWRDVHD